MELDTRKDYNLKVTVRNARILRAIQEAGYDSQASFAMFLGISVASLNSLICMRRSPVGKNGRLSSDAQKLCDELCMLPEDLWNEDQLYLNLRKCTFDFDISGDEMFKCIEDSECVDNLVYLAKLTEREKDILRLSYESDKTTEEIGCKYNISRNRVLQIENKSLQKMRVAYLT